MLNNTNYGNCHGSQYVFSSGAALNTIPSGIFKVVTLPFWRSNNLYSFQSGLDFRIHIYLPSGEVEAGEKPAGRKKTSTPQKEWRRTESSSTIKERNPGARARCGDPGAGVLEA